MPIYEILDRKTQIHGLTQSGIQSTTCFDFRASQKACTQVTSGETLGQDVNQVKYPIVPVGTE